MRSLRSSKKKVETKGSSSRGEKAKSNKPKTSVCKAKKRKFTSTGLANQKIVCQRKKLCNTDQHDTALDSSNQPELTRANSSVTFRQYDLSVFQKVHEAELKIDRHSTSEERKSQVTVKGHTG